MTEGDEPVSWIELGVVARPHGVTGEVRVHVFNSESTLLRELGEIFLIGEEGEEPALVEIVSTRQGSKALLMRLAGVSSLEDAESLRRLRTLRSAGSVAGARRGRVLPR